MRSLKIWFTSRGLKKAVLLRVAKKLLSLRFRLLLGFVKKASIG